MAAVTDIKQTKRRANRVSVYIDGDFWTAMSLDCLTDLGLTVGDQLTGDDVAKAEAHVAETEALGYCLRAVSAMARSRHQLAEGLRKREFSERVIAAALDECQRLLLVDDEQYARNLIDGRLASGYGRRRIERSLADAGIDRDMCDALLDELVDDDSQRQSAQQQLAVKFRGPVTRKDRQRATAFLVRRGFSPSDAIAATSVLEGADEASRPSREDREQSPAPDVDWLRAQIERRYPTALIGDRRAYQRAWGWLARRGVRADLARALLSSDG